MMETRGTRLVGLLALGALALHGMGVQLDAADSGIWYGSSFDHCDNSLAFAPGLPDGVLPIPNEVGWLVEAPTPPAIAPRSRPHPSRGPPA